MNPRLPAVDLIRRPGARSGGRRPEGDVILEWILDGEDSPTVMEVSEWIRLDHVPVGTEVTVRVQGRAMYQVNQPLFGRVEHVVMTGDVADRVDVVVGDDRPDDGWMFGVCITGASQVRHRRRRAAPA